MTVFRRDGVIVDLKALVDSQNELTKSKALLLPCWISFRCLFSSPGSSLNILFSSSLYNLFTSPPTTALPSPGVIHVGLLIKFNMRRALRHVGHNLDRRAPIPNHRDPLPAVVPLLIPSSRMQLDARKVVQAGDIGPLPVREKARGGDEDIAPVVEDAAFVRDFEVPDAMV